MATKAATKAKATWVIEVASDLAVVGYNPESADLDRPNGEIVGEVFYLRATNARGDAQEFGAFDTLDAAEASIPFAPPVFLWTPGRPVYGSSSYVAYGQDDDIESERRHQDAEAWGFDTRFMIF
jgi:hypothetical protein